MTSWSTVITLKLAAAQPIKKFLYLVWHWWVHYYCYTRWFKYDRDCLHLFTCVNSPGHIWTTLYIPAVGFASAITLSRLNKYMLFQCILLKWKTGVHTHTHTNT
jgi:hypothetical protein